MEGKRMLSQRLSDWWNAEDCDESLFTEMVDEAYEIEYELNQLRAIVAEYRRYKLGERLEPSPDCTDAAIATMAWNTHFGWDS